MRGSEARRGRRSCTEQVSTGGIAVPLHRAVIEGNTANSFSWTDFVFLCAPPRGFRFSLGGSRRAGFVSHASPFLCGARFLCVCVFSGANSAGSLRGPLLSFLTACSWHS